MPPHANSAVDGFAIAHADLLPDRETVLPVTGRAAAGHPLGRPIAPGEAIRIFTGAPMPDGADTVMMQEDCVFADGEVRLKPGIRKGANRRHAGEDVTKGSLALARRAAAQAGRSRFGRGARTRHAAGIPAIARRAAVDRRRGLRAGHPLGPGAIYDANRAMLGALLRGLGVVVERSRHLAGPRRCAGRVGLTRLAPGTI